MNFNYEFSNLLGTVYRQGNLVFSPDGNTVFSPVGNKISRFDLKTHKSETLPIESRFDYTTLALDPKHGVLLLAANQDGQIELISLISRTVLHKLRTNRTINALSFSPDGKQFAVAKENLALVYKTPGSDNRQFNPFELDRVLKGAFDETTTLTWSSCSRILAVGSKDNTTRLYSVRDKFANFTSYCLGGHSDPIVATFFQNDSLNCYTLSRNGHLIIWQASLEPDQLKYESNKKSLKRSKSDSDQEDDEEATEEDKAEKVVADEDSSKKSRLFYTRQTRHFLRDALPQEQASGNRAVSDVTAADYHQQTKILVTGFSNGAFLIHEMPAATLIHTLSISDRSIATITMNPSGDWIAFGCAQLGQLLVWEWQSETFVLKQQGHFNNMACVTYAPDGASIATGGQDGKVKLWSTSSGFCYVTFNEHTASVSSVKYGKTNVVFSSSLDGTVRAYDTTRYRNFRTFTSPRPAQFSGLATDPSCEMVASGATDVYEIFLWSVQTGHLLEVIAGHEGPVSGLAFSPSPTSSQLASGSWDKTVKIWDSFGANSSNAETVDLGSDVTCVAYRPDGGEVAVSTLNGHITFFNSVTAQQTGTIESGQADLAMGRSDTDQITAKKSKKGRAFFSSISYTADGECILAGGQSKTICIYHVKQMLLVKKFEVTQNRSFDAMDEVISKKKLTEFGNLALIEDREDPRGKQAIKLPGTTKGDMSSRAHKPQVLVSQLEFSPTGREFAAATTEGLLIYSLDTKMTFDPFELDLDVTPKGARMLVKTGNDYSRALIMALRLNETDLIREIIEQIPHDQIDLLTANLSEKFVEKLLKFVGSEVEDTRHIGFYAKWAERLLSHHGLWIKRRSKDLMPVLNQLHKALGTKTKDIGALCERNIQTTKFLLTINKLKHAKAKEEITICRDGNSSSDDEEEGVQDTIPDRSMTELASKWSDDSD